MPLQNHVAIWFYGINKLHFIRTIFLVRYMQKYWPHFVIRWTRSEVAYLGVAYTDPSPRGGAFGGEVPQIETWNIINQLSFCQFLEWQAPPAQTQSPPIENFLATVLCLYQCVDCYAFNYWLQLNYTVSALRLWHGWVCCSGERLTYLVTILVKKM